MKQEHKSYDENFKKTIVDLYESGKRKFDLTREYDVSYASIDNWIKRYGTIGEVTNNDEIIKLKNLIILENIKRMLQKNIQIY